MKKFLACTVLILFLTSCTRDPHPQHNQAAQLVLKEGSIIIKSKFELKSVGLGVAMPGGPIQEFCFAVNSSHELKKEDLRRLLIAINTEMVNVVNNKEEIRPFLQIFPFTEKNIHIIIYNTTNGQEVYDPGISTAQILKGILSYKTTDIKNTKVFKNRYMETYDEALKLIGQNN